MKRDNNSNENAHDNDMSMEMDIDTSWMAEEERLANLQHQCLPEPLTYLSVQYWYIDQSQTLLPESIVLDKILLNPHSKNILTKEYLMSLVQNHKRETNQTQYVLKDTLYYHLPLPPEHLTDFLDTSFETSRFLKSYPILEDIELAPSIFVFHPYNTLIFVYVEQEKPAVKKIKSALKNPQDKQKRRFTKRVRIQVPDVRHTRHSRN